jgi:hypothetical protein
MDTIFQWYDPNKFFSEEKLEWASRRDGLLSSKGGQALARKDRKITM